MDPTSYIFWLGVAQIIGIDVLLSGDNAVVIALACRQLSPDRRRYGIAGGVALAIVLRLLLASCAALALSTPYLKTGGAFFLVVIAIKLIWGDDGDADSTGIAPLGLVGAVLTVAAADLTMSLDNVVAVAAAANGHDVLFVLGLLVSMPFLIVGAATVSAMLTRWPALVVLGGGLLGWIAGDLLYADPAWTPWVAGLTSTSYARYLLCGGAALAVMGAGYALRSYDTHRLAGIAE